MPVMRSIAVLALLGVIAVAAAFGLAADDWDRNIPEEPVATSVDEIVDVPAKFLREPIRVTGTAVPVDGERFVLRGTRDLIVVRPEPGVLEGPIRGGERVTVAGVVENFDRLQIAELRELLASGRHPALAAAPTALDDPFVSADRVDT